ncbi:(Fe-S)-binding protein [Tepidibacillus sp. HK-1]|uniref:(Fe-S)-binding protein n=1 Tax=Tepidibacillus sp. HK-1 TaxID=1883407 RepID=UPI000853020D|nr:(Fe-S)-binding protein [Tepidibacillus sp. HK-1]GBF10371.1 succinate dehydrogenase/fumarate reductase iron-sulfur subunit [Tepidibacillus sp. HK-1]
MWQLFNLFAFIVVVIYGFWLFYRVLYARYTYIKLGKDPNLEKNTKARWKSIVTFVLGQKKLLKDKKSGVMHVFLFYGAILVQFGAIDLIGKGFMMVNGWYLPVPFYHFFTLSQELLVGSVFFAVLFMAYRRYVEKLPRLQRSFRAGLVYWLLAPLMTSVIVAGGAEMVILHEDATIYKPFSSFIYFVIHNIPTNEAYILFYAAWWAHILLLLSYLVYLPQSKQAHEIFAIVNVYYKRLHSPGKLSTISFEDEEQEEFGVGKIEDFTQKQLLDLYSCVECGRCTNMCPASATGKALSPMRLIIKLRDHLTEKGEVVAPHTTPWAPGHIFKDPASVGLPSVLARQEAVVTTDGATALKPLDELQLIGDVITEEEIWACTTCRNCEDQCPVTNEHVDKIVDLRRYLVLTQGEMSPEAARTLNNIERQGNPWGINRKERANWRQEREDIMVPTVKETKEFEYLFFVGSMGSFDNRSKKIAQSLVKIFQKAGITFAILGNDEKNSGDSARRIGNEYLFQQLAKENIANFQKYNVKRIVTIDPHAYNTFKNEYPEFGLDAEVYHHTEVLAKLIQEARIKPQKEVKERITYHDSCYLGRYNENYDTPRLILKSIPGVELVEMERSKQDAMCCGAGGGLMWLEEKEGTRINVLRTEQALQLNPTTIATACPYCLTMISDGTKAKGVEEDVKTLDVVELLERSLV